MNQRRTIMGACEYSIEMLRDLKKGMMDFGGDNQEMAWAIGGTITCLVSMLLQISNEVIYDSMNAKESDAITDLRLIQSKFNEHIENMIQGVNTSD